MATFADLRPQIEARYASLSLPEVKTHFKEECGFESSDNQWKKKIRQWGLKKNVRKTEYKAMVKKKSQRGPEKETSFILRGKEVRPDKVARFEKTASMQASSPLAEGATPPGLECLSPTESQDHFGVLSSPPMLSHIAIEHPPTHSSFAESLQMTYELSQAPSVKSFTRCDSFEEFRKLVSSANAISPNLWPQKILLGFACFFGGSYDEQKEIETFMPKILEKTRKTECERCKVSRLIAVCRQDIELGILSRESSKGIVTGCSVEVLEKIVLASTANMTQMWFAKLNTQQATVHWGRVYSGRGKILEVKCLLHAAILNINVTTENPESRYISRFATFTLARYYMHQGERSSIDELLISLFGPVYVSIVISAVKYLDSLPYRACRGGENVGNLLDVVGKMLSIDGSTEKFSNSSTAPRMSSKEVGHRQGNKCAADEAMDKYSEQDISEGSQSEDGNSMVEESSSGLSNHELQSNLGIFSAIVEELGDMWWALGTSG